MTPSFSSRPPRSAEVSLIKRSYSFFRIELKQNYHRGDDDKKTFFPILSIIAAYLNVNVYSRTRLVNDKIFYAYIVISHNSYSHKKVRLYFDKFSLFSSKKLAFDD